jgi:hypothetical protein
MSFLSSRAIRIAAAVAVASAIAASPASAQDAPAAGTLAAGDLTVVPPVITAFNFELTGATATVPTNVAAYTLADATGSNAGWSLAVTATAPTVDTDPLLAGTGSTVSLTPTAATAATGNPTVVGNAPETTAGLQLLDPVDITTVLNADAATGQGAWDVAAGTNGLSVVIPGDASEGAFLSTLTYTMSPPVV